MEIGSAAPAGPKAVAPEKPLPSGALDDAALASARSAPAKGDESGGPRSIASLLEAPAAAPKPSASGTLASGAVEPRVGDVVAAPLNLEVSIAGPRVAVPEGLAQRSPEARKPLVEQLGGNEESEDAVGRALAWLARQQEPDGRWTYVSGNSRPGQRPPRPHDTALTGLALLAFLGADHTPDKPGPYQKVTAAAVEYLLAQQRSNGDLRGRFAGGGADAGNMYDQGIATLALCEAALMTGDGRVVDAAARGAEFIVKAQHRQTGGWRYVPGEHGDTSVFGWQVMALHSAKQLGVEVPQRTSELAARWVEIASVGEHGTLAGYQPNHGPTPAMTAELLFARILLGGELTPEGEQEACDFLAAHAPNPRQADFYGWYYASLSLHQLQNDAWKQWNERTRDVLVAMQRRGGDDDGCWSGNIQWADRGGRVYSTALGCLTLEVYYRYLPLDARRSATQPAPKLPNIGYLTR